MITRNSLLAVSLFLFNLWLNWKILLPGVIPYRGSIERGYAYMARLFAANPDYLSWNHWQYCGIPMHFVYLPLLPYFDAMWLWLLPAADATYVHRAVCGIAVLAAPSAVFLLFVQRTASRNAALWAGLAVTLISPLYALIETIDGDRGLMQVPWRIQVLIKYGEGPHSVGIFLLILALAVIWRAATRPGFPLLFASALMMAATVLTNWVAGIALAFAVSMLLVAHIGDSGFRHRRVIIAGFLGYLLAAFWLTPDFVFRMARNWPKDAFGFQFEALERYSLLGWAAALILIRLVFRRFPNQRFLCWLSLCTFGFGYLVALFYRYGVNPIPEARRYALEYEMFLVLLVVEALRLCWIHGPRGRSLAIAGALLVVYQNIPEIYRFVEHRYVKWAPEPHQETPEFRVAAELERLRPSGRVFATGGTRFRLNSWFLVPQIGGVFESGLRSRTPLDVAYQIRTDLGFPEGKQAELSITMLRALAVEYIVIHGRESAEFYRDFKNPEKFEGVLEKVWQERGDSIYKIPGHLYAHLVRPGEIPNIEPRFGYYLPWIDYVGAMMDPSRPELSFNWNSNKSAIVEGSVTQGMHVALSVTYDENWHAYQDGREIPVESMLTGLTLLKPHAAANTRIELRFEPSRQEILCAALSAATLAGCLLALFFRRRTVA